MNKPITDFAQVASQWLSARLHFTGHLKRDEVTHVSVVPSRSRDVSRLNVEYSSDSVDLPNGFFLKIGSGDECVDRDVLFHRDMASLMEVSPSVRYFDAVYDPETTRAHLLTEDHSQTHYHGDWAISPFHGSTGREAPDARKSSYCHSRRRPPR